MGIVLGIFEQFLLLGSLLLYTGVVFWIATRGTSGVELAMRVSALFVGAMVVVGTQVAGLSFASFTIDALSSARPAAALIGKVGGTLLPGGVGLGMGWYLTHSLHKNENIGMRIMAFVGMLAASEFAAIYLVAASRHGIRLGAAALPNIFFVVGILLYTMLKYDPSQRRPRHPSRPRPRFRDLPGSLAGRFRGEPRSGVTTAFQEANQELRRTMNPPAGNGPVHGVTTDSGS